jgi:acetoin utilization deacetylase AcuC-like enzyme
VYHIHFTQKANTHPLLAIKILTLLVAAGFDASYMDPLGHMMLGSEDYRYFTAALQQHAAASPHCQVSWLPSVGMYYDSMHAWKYCLPRRIMLIGYPFVAAL